MTVILTSPVEGKQPGDTYTGANEAYLVASGYAKKSAGPFTGPGLDNTGPSDTTIANNREFDATRGNIATGSKLGDGGGTNTDVTTKAYPAATTHRTGTSA